MYRIIKSFNNNVILCEDMKNTKEYILIGKGIGFNAKADTLFSTVDKIEKLFVIDDDKKSNLKELYDIINPNFIGVATEALSILTDTIDWDVNSKSYMALLDHLVFAIERFCDNIILENQFRAELKALYEYEWGLATKVVEFINTALNLSLNEDEIAFVTMHINGILNKTKAVDSAKQAVIIKNLMDFLEKELNLHIDKDSLYYNRLIIHLRLAINRVVKGISENNILIDHIKEKLSKAYGISEMVGEFLLKNYNIILTENELGFIALHIDRLLSQGVTID